MGSKRLQQIALLALVCALVLASTLFIERNSLTGALASNGALTPSQMLGRLMFAKRTTIAVDGQVRNIWTSARTVGEALNTAGVNLGPIDRIEPSLEQELNDDTQVSVIRVTEELVREEVVVPFRTVRLPSRSLNRGESREVKQGVNGLVVNTYPVLKEDGQEKERTLVDAVTVAKKQDRPIEEGTVATISRGGQALRYSKSFEVTATAYTADYNPIKGGPDDPWKGMTACGQKAVAGKTIAADLKVLPMYSRVYVEGIDSHGKKYSGYYVVMDTGGAIKGNKIDIFMNTYLETKNFGRRKMKVYLLE